MRIPEKKHIRNKQIPGSEETVMVVINQFQDHKMQELAITDKLSRFVKEISYWLTWLHSKAKSCNFNHGASNGTEKMLHSIATVPNLVMSTVISYNGDIVNMCIVPVKIRYVKKGKKLPHMSFSIIGAREPL